MASFCSSGKKGEERERKRDALFALNHCLECSVLSGCYFVKFKLPKKKAEGKGLLHPNCDCKLLNIQKPTNQVIADCNITKFTDYIFGEKYASNGKINLFKDLGFNKEDSEYLKQKFDRQARECYLRGDYKIGKLDRFGQRIDIKIRVQSRTRNNIEFIAGWMIKPLGKIVCTTHIGDKK